MERRASRVERLPQPRTPERMRLSETSNQSISKTDDFLNYSLYRSVFLVIGILVFHFPPMHCWSL